MIYNSGKIYATVWKSTPSENGKYIDLQVSTSEKNQNDEYVNSSWFPRAIGHAANSLKDVKEKDRICITKSKFSNEKYTDKDGNKRSSFKFLILEAELVQAQQQPTQAAQTNSSPAQPNASVDEEDPW